MKKVRFFELMKVQASKVKILDKNVAKMNQNTHILVKQSRVWIVQNDIQNDNQVPKLKQTELAVGVHKILQLK